MLLSGFSRSLSFLTFFRLSSSEQEYSARWKSLIDAELAEDVAQIQARIHKWSKGKLVAEGMPDQFIGTYVPQVLQYSTCSPPWKAVYSVSR